MANVLGDLRKQVSVGRAKGGTICPCCGLYVREYHRRITSSMVWGLALVRKWYKTNDPTLQQYLKVDEYFRELKGVPLSVMRGDFVKLVYWGLVERQRSRRLDGSDHVGLYRITQKGIDFLDGKIEVPKTVTIFNGKKIGMSPEKCKVIDCLNKKFDYNKLMSI